VAAELLPTIPKYQPSTHNSLDLSALNVYTSKKNWYREMVLNRTQVNKQYGCYIVLMIDNSTINEYQYVQEFKPYGLLSNIMMHLISREWNEKFLDNIILEMPASVSIVTCILYTIFTYT
jgi:hypothetical protein